jgi:hypothetical protein
MNQAAFLLGAGIGELLLRTDPADLCLPAAAGACKSWCRRPRWASCSRCWWWGKDVALPGHRAMPTAATVCRQNLAGHNPAML